MLFFAIALWWASWFGAGKMFHVASTPVDSPERFYVEWKNNRDHQYIKKYSAEIANVTRQLITHMNGFTLCIISETATFLSTTASLWFSRVWITEPVFTCFELSWKKNKSKTFPCKKQKQCFIINPLRWESNFHFVWDWHIIFMLLNCIKKYLSHTVYNSTEMKHERIARRTHSQSIFIYSFHVNPRKKGFKHVTTSTDESCWCQLVWRFDDHKSRF